MPEKNESYRGLAPLAELGVIQNNVIGSFRSEEEVNIQDVSIDQLKKMCRTDGQASALYRILTMPIKASKWAIVPEDGGETEADFIRDNFTKPPHLGGMSTPMSYVIASMARAIRDGFAYFEKVYKMEGGKVLYKKLAPRDPETITFLTDAHGGYAGARQRAYYKGRPIDVVIPQEKGFFFTIGKEENPLYGQSMFLPAFYHYDKKHKLYYIANLAHLVTAIPARWSSIPENTPTEIINLVRATLANIGLNTAFTLPEGFEVQTFESSRALGDFMSLINHHDNLMAKSILAQFLDLGGSGSGGGSYSLGETHADIFVQSLEAILKDIEDVISWYVIPDLIDYNFGSGKYPKFQFEPLSDKTKLLLRAVFTEVVKAQDGKISDEFMLEVEKTLSEELGFEIDYEEIKAQRLAEMEMRREAEAKALSDAKNVLAKQGLGGTKNGSDKVTELSEAVDDLIKALSDGGVTETD